MIAPKPITQLKRYQLETAIGLKIIHKKDLYKIKIQKDDISPGGIIVSTKEIESVSLDDFNAENYKFQGEPIYTFCNYFVRSTVISQATLDGYVQTFNLP